jgi:hypothetical protein
MKSTYLTPVAYAALLIGCTIANAQTSKAPSDEPSTAAMSDQADATKGNNLMGTTPTDQTSSPPSAGQDKPSGNDLVSPNGNGTHGSTKLASASRPDFDTLDVKKTGALTADEVKSNTWLSTNFTRCDTNHDGKLSREEYAACK